MSTLAVFWSERIWNDFALVWSCSTATSGLIGLVGNAVRVALSGLPLISFELRTMIFSEITGSVRKLRDRYVKKSTELHIACPGHVAVMDGRKRITPKLMNGIVGLRYTESGNSIMFGIERRNDYVKPLKQNKMLLVNLTRYQFLWQNFEDTVLQISSMAVRRTTQGKLRLVYKHHIIVFEEELDRFEFTCRLGKNAIQRDNSEAQPDSQYIDYNTLKTATMNYCKSMLEPEGSKKKQISTFKRWVASKKDKLFGKDGEPEVAISYPEPEPVTPSSQAEPRSAIEHPVEVDARKCKKNRPPPLDDSLHVENDEEPDPVRSPHPTNRAHESPIVTKVGPSMASITRHGFESSIPLPQSAPPLIDLPEPESVTRSSHIEPRSATEHLVEVDTRKRKKNRPPQLDVSLHVENDEEPDPVRSPHPTNRGHESPIVTKVGPSMASITRHGFESSRPLPQSAPPLIVLPQPEPVTPSSQAEPRSATEHPVEVDTRKRKKNIHHALNILLHVDDDELPDPVRSLYPTNGNELPIVTKAGPPLASITRRVFESSRPVPQSAPPLARPNPFSFEDVQLACKSPKMSRPEKQIFDKMQYSRPLPQSAPVSTKRSPLYLFDLQSTFAERKYSGAPHKSHFPSDSPSDEEGRPLQNPHKGAIPDEYLASKRFESTKPSETKFEPRSPVAKLITDFDRISGSP